MVLARRKKKLSQAKLSTVCISYESPIVGSQIPQIDSALARARAKQHLDANCRLFYRLSSTCNIMSAGTITVLPKTPDHDIAQISLFKKVALG